MDGVAVDRNSRFGQIKTGAFGNGIKPSFIFFLNNGFGHYIRLLKVTGSGITLLLLPGCEDSLSTLHPAGPAADAIATIWWVMLVASCLIFALVMVLLALAFRRSGSAGGGEKLWLVGLGLAFPMTVLATLLGYGLVIGERLIPREGADVVTVGAEGRQWEWSFTYDDLPGHVTERVLHIPAGTPVDVEITSADVIHSFWVPRLAGKLDAIPGHVNVLRIEAWEPGEFSGVSAEYSGPGYLSHRFTVIAHDAQGWADFLQGATE